jgi:predicted NBD/HSP70 family sugar kinase
MAAAGADIVVCHLGLTTGGTIGAGTALKLADCVEPINAWAAAAKSVNEDVIVLCHGGPIATPEDAARAGAYLGVLIQNVWMTFNPTVIVLGGETVERGDEFLDPALAAVQQFATEAGIAPPQIRIARYGSLATAVGGAAYVLHCMLRPIYG